MDCGAAKTISVRNTKMILSIHFDTPYSLFGSASRSSHCRSIFICPDRKQRIELWTMACLTRCYLIELAFSMPNKNSQIDLSITAEINLYYDLHLPEKAERPFPLLIAVHGYGAHKRYMMREAKLVVPENFAIVSLQGPHQHFRRTDDGYRIGFGWLSDHKPDEYVRLHHNFVLDVINKLSGEGLIDRGRIYMYGFSQACALDFRFAFTHPEVLRGIIGVCGGIPGDLETNEKYATFEAA